MLQKHWKHNKTKNFFTHLIQLEQKIISNTDIYAVLDLINKDSHCNVNYCLSNPSFSIDSQKVKGKTIITLGVQALQTKSILEKNLLITCTLHESTNVTSVWHNKIGST
jgi:hypothetical protein